MKIALIQTDPRPDWLDQNCTRAFDMIAEAAEAGAELCILPEMWPRSYVDALETEEAGQPWPQVLERWQTSCREAGVACIGGLPRKVDEHWLNAAMVIDANGDLLATYDKLHLFSLMHEDQRYQAGDAVVTVELGGTTIGLAVCYDLRFPEFYRSLRDQCADLLVTIAQWPSARVSHWDTLLEARAIENLCYSIGVNRCGEVPATSGPIAFPGHSAVIDPWGDVVERLDEREQVAVVELDLTRISSRREAFSSWEDRRFQIGKLL